MNAATMPEAEETELEIQLEHESEGAIVPMPAASSWRDRINTKFVYALLDQGIVSFGNMVVAASVARTCAAGDFGTFILALRTIDILYQLCGVLIWGPYTFNLPSVEPARQARYRGSVLAHQLFAGAAGALILLALGFVASARGSHEYTALLFPLVLPSLTIVFREFTRRDCFSHLQFGRALVLDTITVALQVGAIFFLIRRNALTPGSALAALALAAAAVCIFWLATEWKKLSFGLRDIRSDLSLNMQLGKWFLGSNMVTLASMQISPWMLSATTGTASVAAYAVCEAVVNIPRVALTSMQNTMAPTMARAFASGGRPALRKVVRRMDILILGGSTAFAVGIIAFGPWASHAIFRKTPLNSRTILVLLALNLVAYGASLAQSYGLSAINRAQFNFSASVIGLVAQLAVALTVIHRYGVPGVAFALLIGNLAVLAARIFYYMREMRRT